MAWLLSKQFALRGDGWVEEQPGVPRPVRRFWNAQDLLGTTAVVGAALLAPAVAVAQEAPTVRIGGFFRAYYGYTQQSGRNSTVPTTLATSTGSASGNLPADGSGIARLSKNDFSTDAQVQVFVNGKTANGLSYGAVVEIAFNQMEGRNIVQQRASAGKTTAAIDEYYAFIASPT